MAQNIETLAAYPEVVKRLQSAFPHSLSAKVEAIAEILPIHRLVPTQHDIGAVSISGEELHIPSRFYSPEPVESSLTDLNSLDLSILACLYTRHHDGFVRLKYVEKLFPREEIWVSPFVLQLLGEYVVEIVEVISQNMSLFPINSYNVFIKENPVFVHLLKQRIVSYWNCYYRSSFPHFKDYVGFQVGDRLGLWNRGDLRNLEAR
jgi:hypothetical protein